MMWRVALPLTAAILTSACAASSDKYPSLATRDAERMAQAGTPSSAFTPAAESAEVIRATQAASERARALHQSFLALHPNVLRLTRAAQGSGVDSNATSRALVAQAELLDLHAQMNLALGELDALEARAAGDLERYESVRAAQTQVAALKGEQDARIAAITGGQRP